MEGKLIKEQNDEEERQDRFSNNDNLNPVERERRDNSRRSRSIRNGAHSKLADDGDLDKQYLNNNQIGNQEFQTEFNSHMNVSEKGGLRSNVNTGLIDEFEEQVAEEPVVPPRRLQ